MFSSTGNLRVRLVEPNDEPFVFMLFCSVRGPEYAASGLSSEEQMQILHHQYRAMHSTYAERFPNGQHYIVSEGDQDIGRIYVNESADEIRLLDVIVHPNQRNRGLGSKLLKQMIKHGKRHGKTVRFYVWATNHAAQRFYKRHGFVQVRDDQSYLLFERTFT